MMALALAQEPIPLHLDGSRVLRIGGTRVTLDTLVDKFESGATPEEIAQDFPVLDLADVYAVITYYLRHRSEVDEYLDRRRQEAYRMRERVASHCDPTGLRQRLLARRGQ